MGFFNRRTAPADANTEAAVNSSGPREKHRVMSSRDRRHKQSSGSAYGQGTMNKRPTFGQWFKVTWPDILTMIVMGAVGLGVR